MKVFSIVIISVGFALFFAGCIYKATLRVPFSIYFWIGNILMLIGCIIFWIKTGKNQTKS